MIRCTTCLMPDTRPDTPFENGVCAACISYQKRPLIDWDARKQELINLLDRHDGRCIVPSSGGKDSTAQVIALLALGADVTIVTATTCHLTPIGRHNIDNLAKYARTIEVSPNKTVRAKLNRLGLELVGDISWPEHVAIFTTPFKMAQALDIPLIFFGENPQEAYGGPLGSDAAMTMTLRWRSEFGGFLGLRPDDLVGQDGITERDMSDYKLSARDIQYPSEAHFLGQYLEWDSRKNADIAQSNGMQIALPTRANWWAAENQDNAQTGIHDHMMYRKYGYGRGCAQVSVDIRTGRHNREAMLRWVGVYDGMLDATYAGVHLNDILYRMKMSNKQLTEVMGNYTRWELFEESTFNNPHGPLLKEFYVG